LLIAATWTVLAAPAAAAAFRVTTADSAGAPLAATLLIVRSLEGRGEAFRALTDNAGALAERELEAGRYRIVATYPYGAWKTTIREFVVEKTPVALRLALSPVPTAGKKVAAVKKPRLAVLTLDAKARPVPGIAVLVRDPEATAEAWYQTNAKGEVTIDLSAFAGAVTLVSFAGAVVTERELAAAEIATLTRKRGRIILRVV
jgi:hypothetical protein